MTITTSKICAIPELRPPPAKKPLKIECQPVLTPHEFEKYERHLKYKEKSALKKAEEMKLKRKEVETFYSSKITDMYVSEKSSIKFCTESKK